jgi:hypothetical protein
MEKVTSGRDLKVTTVNEVGILAKVTDLIAAGGINIDYFCAHEVEDRAVFYFMASDHAAAKRVLESNGYTVEERGVIVLELWNRPGILSQIAHRFRQEDIHLRTVYGASSPGGERTTVVFCAEDNEKASEIFDAMVLEGQM